MEYTPTEIVCIKQSNSDSKSAFHFFTMILYLFQKVDRLGELDKRLGLREGAAGLLLGRAVRRHNRAEDVLQHALAEVEDGGRARGAPAS